jgi:hypothetical protein
VPSLTPGSWVIAAPDAVLHASLSSAFFPLRQVVISSALGMNSLQSLSTSGVHAMRCSSVPCEKEGAGKTVADSRASKMSHGEQASRGIIHFFRLFTLIREPAIRNPESIFEIFMAETNTLLPKPVLVAKCRPLELSTPLRSFCSPFGPISHRSDAHRHAAPGGTQFRIGHSFLAIRTATFRPPRKWSASRESAINLRIVPYPPLDADGLPTFN